VDVAQDAPVAPLFVVMNDVRSDVEAALQGWEIEAPVLSIDRGFARLDGPCPNGLAPFVREQVPRRWPPGAGQGGSSVLHPWVAGLSGRRAGWRFERCEIGKAPQVRGFPSVLIGIVRGVRAEL
jgi:hypothetical protein